MATYQACRYTFFHNRWLKFLKFLSQMYFSYMYFCKCLFTYPLITTEMVEAQILKWLKHYVFYCKSFEPYGFLKGQNIAIKTDVSLFIHRTDVLVCWMKTSCCYWRVSVLDTFILHVAKICDIFVVCFRSVVKDISTYPPSFLLPPFHFENICFLYKRDVSIVLFIWDSLQMIDICIFHRFAGRDGFNLAH